MKAHYQKYILKLKQPSKTSRETLTEKETYFLYIKDTQTDKQGIGECALFKGLSHDNPQDYEQMLQWVCNNIHLGKDQLWLHTHNYPSIQFGIEQAFLSLENNGLYFPSDFTHNQAHIFINGLIWMGDYQFMKQQIDQKIAQGFNCIKMKIGALNFLQELNLLDYIRSHYPSNIELRVDANGAFSPQEALDKLHQLSQYGIHSIEQPIKPNQLQEMAQLCQQTPIPIALDEELIGVTQLEEKQKLLQILNPQYIILKPSLVGGIKGATQWINIAQQQGIGWWITSALESNVGLSAIAQWTYTLNTQMPQGLGTGGLFTNNTPTTMYVEQGKLYGGN